MREFEKFKKLCDPDEFMESPNVKIVEPSRILDILKFKGKNDYEKWREWKDQTPKMTISLTFKEHSD